MTVLRFDAETGRVLDFRLVAVHANGTAQVDPALRWPTAPEPEPLPGAPV